MVAHVALTPAPFTIQVEDATLEDLRRRLRQARLPAQVPGIGWEQGTELGFLRRFLTYWADGFDWRREEARLNAFQHFRADVDGVAIHFVHERARDGKGIPLILTHRWPSAFAELLPLVPLLTDPARHGIAGPSFDLVLPSLPGYGFSGRPAHANYRTVAGMWHRLMQRLGYDRYAAGGGDFGAGVSSYMALDAPDRILGLHLTTPELSPPLEGGSPPLTEAEARYLEDVGRWDAVERGYSAIQSTRPQTLGYALNASPAGLAAWILEKWRTWSDSGGDLLAHVSPDFLCTLLTLYWATESITTSMRDYHDNRWRGAPLRPGEVIRVPTAFARFDRCFASEGSPPREWIERLYAVRRFTEMPRGGHFAAAEEPELLARDLAAFFAEIG